MCVHIIHVRLWDNRVTFQSQLTAHNENVLFIWELVKNGPNNMGAACFQNEMRQDTQMHVIMAYYASPSKHNNEKQANIFKYKSDHSPHKDQHYSLFKACIKK